MASHTLTEIKLWIWKETLWKTTSECIHRCAKCALFGTTKEETRHVLFSPRQRLSSAMPGILLPQLLHQHAHKYKVGAELLFQLSCDSPHSISWTVNDVGSCLYMVVTEYYLLPMWQNWNCFMMALEGHSHPCLGVTRESQKDTCRHIFPASFLKSMEFKLAGSPLQSKGEYPDDSLHRYSLFTDDEPLWLW